MKENKFDNIDKLHNFVIHARGHYVVISGYSEEKDKHTFMATTPILKHILCDMNQRITLGPLSKCQMGGIFLALKSIDCEYDMFTINDKTMIASKTKESGYQRLHSKKNK